MTSSVRLRMMISKTAEVLIVSWHPPCPQADEVVLCHVNTAGLSRPVMHRETEAKGDALAPRTRVQPLPCCHKSRDEFVHGRGLYGCFHWKPDAQRVM